MLTLTAHMLLLCFQHNCPVGNVDLQGRTALHDAVMAGCSSSVKLLCDSGANVNATDFDGRTPLVLATQMCHPRICQLLLEKGADITIRDKQNKTALILGCEYSCKDAVEVLLKAGADLRPQDAFGHDAFHYARHSKSPELLSLLKAQLDRTSREKDAARIEQWKRQHSFERADSVEVSRRDQIIHDLELQNESLQESLKRSHQEQRGLLDQVSQLQQQLTQEKVDECLKEMDSPKLPKEDGARGLETVKVQLKSSMGDYSGQSVIKGKESLLKQAYSLDTEPIQRVSISRSMSRGSEKQQVAVGNWDLQAEMEALRRELEQVRRRQQASEEETSRLQSALNHKNRECQELVQNRDSIQKQADQQIQELEDALGDVQKRMLESECKVKQLQTLLLSILDPPSVLRTTVKKSSTPMNGQAVDVTKANAALLWPFYHFQSSNSSLCVGLVLRRFQMALCPHIVLIYNTLCVIKSSVEDEVEDDQKLTVGEVMQWITGQGYKPRGRFPHIYQTLCDSLHTICFPTVSAWLTKKYKNVNKITKLGENVLNLNSWKHFCYISEKLYKDRQKMQKRMLQLHSGIFTKKIKSVSDTSVCQQLPGQQPKQLHSAHVVAVKEHLGGQANEELRAQLQDVKTKYEGASAEVGRVRNRLKQSEKALEEYKTSESQLAAESERLSQELGVVTVERDEMAHALLQMERQLKEAKTKQTNTVPAEKFDNMKNLLTNAVDEKERQIAELREDYDRVLEEVADLHRRMDSPSVQSANSEEEQRVRATLEENNASLKKRLQEVTAKSQALIQEVEESEEERDLLREQLEKLNSHIESDFIPIQLHEQARHNMVQALEELEDKLVEASERYGRAETQVEQLRSHKSTLEGQLLHLQNTEQEADHLKALNADLLKQLEAMQRRYNEEIQELQKTIDGEYVPRQQMEQIKRELTTTVKDLRSQVAELESRKKEELRNVKEGNDKLKGELEKVRLNIQTNYIAINEHNSVTDQLKVAAVEAENRANKASEMYAVTLDENTRLTQELQAQKQELDTIQEAIQAKFILRTAVEEKDKFYEKQLKELTEKLSKMEDKYNEERKSRESVEREKEQLKAQFTEVDQRLDVAWVERQKELDKEYSSKFVELTVKVQDMEKQRDEVERQNVELRNENGNYATQVQSLQERLRSELTRIANYDNELKALNQEVQQAQEECRKARSAQQEEAQKTCVLQKELQETQVENQQMTRNKERLEAEVDKLRMALKEEEENNAQRAEDVSTLQSELLQATQALEELRRKHEDLSQLQKDKQQLSEEVSGLREKLLLLSEEVQDAREDAALASEQERKAKAEMNSLQEKFRAVEKEVGELKERYDQSLNTIQELQKRIQASAQQTEAKDKKITELLTDVERLKQALNGLSQLAYTSSAPKRQTDSLQAQVKSLQQQLADAERQHREVVSIYRTHLLSAAQGHMDEDVQAALLQIIRMRQEFVC
ncbi:hypothetical protein WMY93_017770 [Mugilogobius chulae]|uniref:Uveal autoantigen with coiled-coil domains and ankyrin repeats b n=1 Tax=Mugilogobius chulae TaxID=88201 RepID=A0AAW0NRX5_9GOBI